MFSAWAVRGRKERMPMSRSRILYLLVSPPAYLF
jgi:hypothetical protein